MSRRVKKKKEISTNLEKDKKSTEEENTEAESIYQEGRRGAVL